MEFRPYYMAREWAKNGHQVTILAASYSHLRWENPSVEGAVTVERIDGIDYVWLRTPAYSGNGWRDTWDTTLTDTNLPTAFRVRIYLASLNTAQIRDRQPLELVVPVLTQGLTNLTSSATTTTQ